MTLTNSPEGSAGRTGDGPENRQQIPQTDSPISSLVGVTRTNALTPLAIRDSDGATLYQVSFAEESVSPNSSAVGIFITSKNLPGTLKGYKLEPSQNGSLQEIVRKFREKTPEHFEAYVSIQLGAQCLLDPDQSNSPPTEEQPERYSECYPTGGTELKKFFNRHGACIKLINDPVRGDNVVVISASDDAESQQLLLRVPTKRWNEGCNRLIEQLVFAEESTAREIISELGQYVSGDPMFFPKEPQPISTLMSDMLTAYRSQSAGADSVLIVKTRPDRTVEEAAERLLEKRDCVMVSYRDRQPSVSRWKKMFVTASDNGSGFLVLCVGRKDAVGSVGDESEDQTSYGRAQYDFNLSDLNNDERTKWLLDLVNTFGMSREEFPGAITDFLNKQSNPSREDSAERVVLTGVRGLQPDHLNATQSVEYFTRKIQSGLKTQHLTVQVLSKDSDQVKLQCCNKSNDALTFTIRPHGIDTIFIAPRPEQGDTANGRGARFSFGNVYQLNNQFDNIVTQIARYLHEERTEAKIFTGRNDCQTGAIGALTVLSYLNGLCAPRETASRHSNFPPQFDAVTE